MPVKIKQPLGCSPAFALRAGLCARTVVQCRPSCMDLSANRLELRHTSTLLRHGACDARRTSSAAAQSDEQVGTYRSGPAIQHESPTSCAGPVYSTAVTSIGKIRLLCQRFASGFAAEPGKVIDVECVGAAMWRRDGPAAPDIRSGTLSISTAVLADPGHRFAAAGARIWLVGDLVIEHPPYLSVEVEPYQKNEYE